MKPAPFSYHAPKTIDEAVKTLARVADDGRVLAGGQSLVPTMAFRLARPNHLVDINGIAELSHLAVDGGKLCIGATVRHAAFERPVVKSPLGDLMSEVVRHIAHKPIRARGTFCGSIAHADPASEWCLVAAALDAEMILRSTRGTRVVPAAKFFDDILTTALEDYELLAEVRIPLLPPETRFGFYEFSRRAGDFAIAMALVTCQLKSSKIASPRVAIGGIEAFPRRIAEAEALLEGHEVSAENFAAAAEAVAKGVEPLDDAQYSADYRRGLVRTVVCRALERATS
jgi:aerobic carbon-monoxide dehydrogenase medium subunit